MKKLIERVLYVVFIVSMTIIMVGACTGVRSWGAEPQLQGKTIVVNKTTKSATTTGYNIQVDGKTYQVMRGPRGGYYYTKGNKKVYLTKAQKALIK